MTVAVAAGKLRGDKLYLLGVDISKTQKCHAINYSLVKRPNKYECFLIFVLLYNSLFRNEYPLLSDILMSCLSVTRLLANLSVNRMQ